MPDYWWKTSFSSIVSLYDDSTAEDNHVRTTIIGDRKGMKTCYIPGILTDIRNTHSFIHNYLHQTWDFLPCHIEYNSITEIYMSLIS